MAMDAARQRSGVWWRKGIHTRDAGRLAMAYGYDWRRFLTFSSTRGPFRTRRISPRRSPRRPSRDREGPGAPSPQPGHGASVLEPLIRLVKRYIDLYGEDDLTAAALGR